MPVRVLLTGNPGVGKTTLCAGVQRRLQETGVPDLLGFLCHELRGASGARDGFKLTTLDGGVSAPLATKDGPATGHRVGNYHVQVESLERVTLPILEAALAERAGRPRLLIFDEIGKMELFSAAFISRVREVLTSRDSNLHVLGTVALRGGGLIAESKGLPGIEVVEITPANRQAAAEDVHAMFAAALGGGDCSDGSPVQGNGLIADSNALPDVEVVEITQATCQAPADDVAPASQSRRWCSASASSAASSAGGPKGVAALSSPRVTFDQPAPGEFSAVYLAEPSGNFASVNAGDYRLYVGGGSINRAFHEALAACGHKPKNRYEALHTRLLEVVAAAPGQLCWLQEGDVEKGVMDDIIAFCGLALADNAMERLLPVGLVSIAVFPEGRRPCGSNRNVAMVYVVGPNCGHVTGKKQKREVDKMSPDKFLKVVEEIAAAMASAVVQYNRMAEEYGIPRIEILRVCLLCGGVYKHPEATKVEVAVALIKGLLRDGAASSADMPLLDFSYDEDAFRSAWLELGLPGVATAAATAAKRSVASPERRIDPEDGRAYTLEELKRYYKSKYSVVEIDKYWWDSCRPMR